MASPCLAADELQIVMMDNKEQRYKVARMTQWRCGQNKWGNVQCGVEPQSVVCVPIQIAQSARKYRCRTCCSAHE